MKHKVLGMIVPVVLLLLAPHMGEAQVTVLGGRAPNEYTATITPAVAGNMGELIPMSLTLMNVTPAREGGCGDDHDEGGCDGGCGDDHDTLDAAHDDGGSEGGCGDDHDEGGCDGGSEGGCGDDHDEGGCGDDHDEGGCGDDHDEGGCGDDHDEGGCGDDHDEGGCSDNTTGPGSMAIKKITLWLPQGITTDHLHHIGYYTMPCGRQWTRTELQATDRIVFVAEHGRAHRLGRGQAFVLTFGLLTPHIGELEWVTELSHCPGNGGRAFQLVTMPGHQPTDAHPLTVLYPPDKDQLAGGGSIVATQPHGSHAPAAGTLVHFTLSAKTQQQGKQHGLQGRATLTWEDAAGTRWQFQADEPLALGINNTFGTQAMGAWLAISGTLRAGNSMLHEVVLHAALVDGGEPPTDDEAAFTLRHHDILLLATHWQDKATLRQPLAGGNIIIIGGGTPAGAQVLQAAAHTLWPAPLPADHDLQLTTWPNPFSQQLHFRFTPAEDGPVLLQLFDSSGRLITTLLDQQAPAGQRLEVNYVPHDQKTGLIIYRLTLGKAVHTGRVLYQK